MSFLALDMQIKLQGTLIAQINNAAKGAVRELMDNNVLPAAREMAPKRTGANADSLSTMTRQRGNQIQSFIRSNSGHGGYDEKGTSKMAAEPYMYPAFEQSLPGLNQILVERFADLNELQDIIADGGIEGLNAAVKEKKFKGAAMSKASRQSAAHNRLLKQQDKFSRQHGGRKSEGPMKPKRKYVRKPKP